MAKEHPHASIIDRWPHRADFARSIGVSPSNARSMRQRGIPPRYFEPVIRANAKAGFPPLTYAHLTTLLKQGKP